jgi:hypothetical protein
MEIRFAGSCMVEAPDGSRILPATSKYRIPTKHPATGPGFKHLYDLIHPDGTVQVIHVTHDAAEVQWHFCDRAQECERP